uniref:Shieldin complex subunit 2 n=1 Tax=Vombatus ursinus TaxID=29139 RepID=A0A4X2LBH6_VOMUR
MSKIPQIHIFFGAPIIPSNTAVSQEQTCSATNADPWKITQLLYDHCSLNVSAEACRCGHLECHHASHPVPVKEHVIVNSDKTRSWRDDDYLTCVPETQCIKSQNSDPSMTIDMAYYNQQMPGFESRVQQHLNERKCHYPVNENDKITDQQKKFESNSCFYSLLRKNSQPINQDYSDIWDLVCSTNQINIEPEIAENDHMPSKNHETVNHYPGFFSPQTTDEPKSKGVIRKTSSFSTSADIEFLSIMTSSKIAFLAQSLDKEQSFPNKGNTSMKPEQKESCREMRLGNFSNFVDEPNQASSLELFSPNCPEPTSNLTPLNCNKGTKENIGSQELFKTPNEQQPTEDFCIESFSTRKMCSQQNAFCKVSIKRNRTSEDKSGPSSTVSESLQGPKRIKSVCSPDAHQISSKVSPERNVSRFGKFLKKTSLLKNCICKSQRYNCLVMALHPCHVKEVHVKTGPNSGCQVPLATITVTDQSEIKKKVVLWRDTAFGVLTVFPGDIILLTDVTIHNDQWYKETVLQSTFTSQLLNLGSCSSVQPKEYSCIVSVTVLQDLLRYISSKHSYIVDLPFRHPQKLESIQYVELDQLQPNTLIHSILKVVSVTIITGVVQVKAQILALVFPVAAHASRQLVLDANSSLEDILMCLPTIVYSGCGKCGLELETDENQIYKQCISCLPFTMVKLYYRSALMTVSDDRNKVRIHVGSEMIQKILLNIPPDWLSRVVVPFSGITYGMVAADLCHSLLASRERAYTLKIQSLFILDENSYPLQQDFYLLDFHTDFEA